MRSSSPVSRSRTDPGTRPGGDYSRSVMRRAALIALLVWAAPQVGAGQAVVGEDADEAALPDTEAPDTEAPVGADPDPAASAEAESVAEAEADPNAAAGAPPPEVPPDDPTAADDPPPTPGAEAQLPAEPPPSSPPAEEPPPEAIPFVHTPDDVPEEAESGPIWASWWFWAAIAAVVLGVTAAVVVDVTTDDPAPSPREPVDPTMMGLVLRF